MVSLNSFREIESSVQLNEQKIKLLHDINSTLNHRYDIKANYDALKTELKALDEAENDRKQRYNYDKHKQLIDMEHTGQKLFKEHAKVIHQIEHINWHLSHAHPHEIATPIELPHLPSKICHTNGIISGHGHGHSHTHCKLHCSNGSNHPNMGFLQMSAERLTKTISGLRHKICQAKQSLDQEIERKKAAEKNVSEARKQISKQKKLMSSKRCVPLPAITTARKCNIK